MRARESQRLTFDFLHKALLNIGADRADVLSHRRLDASLRVGLSDAAEANVLAYIDELADNRRLQGPRGLYRAAVVSSHRLCLQFREALLSSGKRGSASLTALKHFHVSIVKDGCMKRGRTYSSWPQVTWDHLLDRLQSLHGRLCHLSNSPRKAGAAGRGSKVDLSRGLVATEDNKVGADRDARVHALLLGNMELLERHVC